MAGLPVPGPQLIERIPPVVVELIETLRSAGYAGHLVGGSLRDLLLDRVPADWDLATDAQPERIVELFPGAVYENRFGTVAVRHGDATFEITTFRSDHDYADFRRPHRVEFGETLEADLARRDFTVNAMAWGGQPGEPLTLADPFDGQMDLAGRTLRAVGDPTERFGEDALRMIRAVRLSATLGLTIEPRTLLAIGAQADLVEHLSGERIAAELAKLLAASTPSLGLRPLESTGLLRGISVELATQRGVPQNKRSGEDLWDHTVRTVDAAPVDRPIVRLAALVHDIGKPATLSDGRFIGHEVVGATLAGTLLDRLRVPRATADRVAVRRFIAKVGRPALDDLLELRRADNIGSGVDPDAGGLAALRHRIADQLAADVPLDRGALAIDGDDLIAELGVSPGPRLGIVLERLLEAVVEDPALNDRPSLLQLAQAALAEEA